MRDLVAVQVELLLYILPQVSWSQDAEDIQQEVNVWLLAHRAQYDRSRGPFIAWAKNQAKFAVLHWRNRRDRSRECVSSELAEAVGEALPAPEPAAEDPRLRALEECCAELPADRRRLVEDRYGGGLDIKTLAGRLNRPPASVANSLFAIRATLRLCIEGKLKSHANAEE